MARLFSATWVKKFKSSVLMNCMNVLNLERVSYNHFLYSYLSHEINGGASVFSDTLEKVE